MFPYYQRLSHILKNISFSAFCRPLYLLSPLLSHLVGNEMENVDEKYGVDDHVQQIKRIKIPIFHYQIIFNVSKWQ